MPNIKRLIRYLALIPTIALITILVLTGASNIHAQTVYDISTPYVYPTVPGSAAWQALKTRGEKGAACEIPENVLSRLTTAALLETVLDYPLLGDILAWSTPEKGFEILLGNFNGLRELMQRADLTSALDSFSLENSSLVNSSVSYKMSLANKMLLCIRSYLAGFPELLSTNSLIATRSVPDNVTLYTPAGSPVYALEGCTFTFILMEPDVRVQEIIEEQEAYYADAYPDAVKIADATAAYNCHSYAWHGLGAPSNYWINSPAPYVTDMYPNDGITENSFVRISALNENYPQFAYWYNSDPEEDYYVHSVVRISLGRYQSKWGLFGLYEHGLTDHPYYFAKNGRAHGLTLFQLNDIYS